MGAGILSKIRVLDLSRIMSGPWCTQTLGDLGADVIKIEKPGGGDESRTMGPRLHDAEDAPTSDSAMYLSANRNKRSVIIDIATPEGAQLVREIVATCDILVENFKAGSLAKYGLDYETLRAIKPDLIYCSITGFGQDGPYAKRPAYDFVMQAMSGLMSTSGQPEGAPGSAPMRTAIPLTDIVTGLYATIAILAAVIHRSTTGEGQFIDAAMIDSSVALNANMAVAFLMTAQVPKRGGNANAVAAPSDLFDTADGQMIIAVGNDQQFKSLTTLLELPELLEDSRFSANADRLANRAALREIIAPKVRAQPTAIMVGRCAAANIPCGPLNHMHEVFADPQVRHRSMAIAAPHASGVDVRLVRSPLNLSAMPIGCRAPPQLGQHTYEVLTELGFPDERVKVLQEKAIIGNDRAITGNDSL